MPLNITVNIPRGTLQKAQIEISRFLHSVAITSQETSFDVNWFAENGR